LHFLDFDCNKNTENTKNKVTKTCENYDIFSDDESNNKNKSSCFIICLGVKKIINKIKIIKLSDYLNF
jgi:hypothetical protein